MFLFVLWDGLFPLLILDMLLVSLLVDETVVATPACVFFIYPLCVLSDLFVILGCIIAILVWLSYGGAGYRSY